MKVSKRNATVLALATTAIPVFPVFAQEVAPQEAAAETDDVNDIIVTARRRDETLQTTPIAITAINSAALENKGSINLGDLQGVAPNLLITQQTAGAQAANLAIRGMSYADVEKSQEPTVGVVIDGVFIGTNTGQLLDFFDIEQIEVLRGPQGTLFGRNTIGGVINIRRTRPTMEFGGKIEASYGRFDSAATRAVVNVGDGANFGVKGWYFHNQSDGYYRHGITGERVGRSNNENFGASFLFAPTDSDFDALLTVEKVDQRFETLESSLTKTGELACGFVSANECNRNNTSDLYTVFSQPGSGIYKAPAATLEMNYDAGGVKITSITGWRKSKEAQGQDFDASSVDLYYTFREQNYRQISQELRFSGNLFPEFDYVIGGYYFKSRFNLTQFTRAFAFSPTVDPRIADPNPQTVRGNTESYAAFGDFNWAFADRWRLSFGGRFTHDTKKLANSFAGIGLIGTGDESFEKFTPKVGVDFRPNSDTMFYASWSRGYRSGGFSPRAATAETAGMPYGPETVDSFEIGTKLDLLDRKLQFNVAAFYAKYEDLQQITTIPGGPRAQQSVTTNVGSAKIKGIEAEITARPVQGLRLTATMGLLDSHFKNFVAGNSSPVTGLPIPFDYSQNRLIFAPKFSGSLGADYTATTGFGSIVANVGIRHIGTYDQQISLGPLTGDLTNGPVIVNGNDIRVRAKAHELVDASLTANFEIGTTDAYLTVFGRNLSNTKRLSSANTIAGLFTFASAIEPRTYGATLGVKF